MAVPPPLEKQTGIVTVGDGTLSISSVPVPPVSSSSILVRTCAVALNPSDYKVPTRLRVSGHLAGGDFAGVIVAVGSAVASSDRPRCKPWVVGDRVFGAVHGCNPTNPQSGAFAEYIDADPAILTRIPQGWDWYKAAAFGGICVGAVALALYKEIGLALPPQVDVEKDVDSAVKVAHSLASNDDLGRTVLVYGASTACGTMAIQLLRLSGYIPIAVCSSHNNAMVSSYGAASVFDYHSPSCAADIKTATKNQLRFVLDCIGTAQSTALCYAAIARTGGRYVSVERYPESAAMRKLVQGSWVMMLDMFGRGVDMKGGYDRKVDPAARDLGRRLFAGLEMLAQDEDIRPHPMRLVRSGSSWAESVLAGIDMLQKGQVSGEKLVVEIRV
ncbi:putative alcohol dehydrogenase [Talaromyces proteolyticus]|uniref:Alcohol dehydrogenase n=1 Tax=Talaromyces proteolyticus TaxID=1131652 RepID=A0AAD4KFA5_9EURO|nr:putative alcohol dehydrogenase [Talaromyces proteolyticus]KAH8690645.1 putative alcohol dehydrogenase [Talaromyces proteolyticus]